MSIPRLSDRKRAWGAVKRDEDLRLFHEKAIARVRRVARELPKTCTARERAEEDWAPVARSGQTVPPFGSADVGIKT